jgi:hypothetical protein
MEAFSWDRKCLLLTNHALVLGVIAAEPGVRIREIAERVEITERAVESLLTDLIQVGFLTRRRAGRRNVYEVHRDQKLRHPLIQDRDVGDVIAAMTPEGPAAKPEPRFVNSSVFTEQTLTRATPTVDPMIRSATSTKKGVTMKRVLVYMVAAALLVFASAAIAATTNGRKAPKHRITNPNAPAYAKTSAQAAQRPAPAAIRNPRTSRIDASTSRAPSSPTGHRRPSHNGAGTVAGTPAGTSTGTASTSGTQGSVNVKVAGVTIGVGASGKGVSVGVGAGGSGGGKGIGIGVGKGGVTVTTKPTGPANPPGTGGSLLGKLGL